jgi:hypothetical protein
MTSLLMNSIDDTILGNSTVSTVSKHMDDLGYYWNKVTQTRE